MCHDIFNYYVIYLSPLVCDVAIVTCIGLDFAAKAMLCFYAFMGDLFLYPTEVHPELSGCITTLSVCNTP